MFQVKQFEVCKSTGIASFKMEFDLGCGTRVDSGSFVNRMDCEQYILKSKRDYILVLFENFINLIRFQIEDGQKYHHIDSKLESFDRADKYNHWFQDKDLKTICKVILAIEEDLRKILPGSGNPSTEMLEGKLMDLIVFSKLELNKQRA